MRNIARDKKIQALLNLTISEKLNTNSIYKIKKEKGPDDGTFQKQEEEFNIFKSNSEINILK